MLIMDNATQYFSFSAKKIIGSTLLEDFCCSPQQLLERLFEARIHGCVRDGCRTDSPRQRVWVLAELQQGWMNTACTTKPAPPDNRLLDQPGLASVTGQTELLIAPDKQAFTKATTGIYISET